MSKVDPCSPDGLYANPYYTHPCSEVKEDHARHVIVHQYVGCVRIPNEWVVPTNDSVTWLQLSAVVDVLVGSCLWHPDYGYFRITAFDARVQKIQLQRVDVEGTSPAGTTIPMCTKFIFAPEPD